MTSAHAVTIKAGISYRQLDFWTRAGYLVAEDRSPWERQGYPREYPADQVQIAVEMGRLVKAGIPPKVARDLAGQLVADGRARLGRYQLAPVATAEAS